MSKLLASFAIFGLFGAAGVTDWESAGKAWWKHVEYLASDELEGRNVGSQGFEKAANYVATEFERAGLKPAGTQTYFQPVAFTEVSLNAEKSTLALVRDGQSTPVPVPQEAQLGYSAESAPQIEAPVVFAGYGLVIPEAHYDDLQGLNVKGAIVAFLAGGPKSIDGNLRSHYSSTEERWKALRAAGAVGTISIPNPKTMEIPWNRQEASWGRPRVSLADQRLLGTRGLKFNASWNPAKADDLLAGSGHTFQEILDAANNQLPLPHFALRPSIRASLAISEKPVESKNVVGVRPGDDPQLKNEYVVISAHLDHIGVGKPVNGDSIYNGAMDDASGVASLIEIAKNLHTEHVSTRRSLESLSQRFYCE